MFKVNNVSIGNFEQVNVSWEIMVEFSLHILMSYILIRNAFM